MRQLLMHDTCSLKPRQSEGPRPSYCRSTLVLLPMYATI